MLWFLPSLESCLKQLSLIVWRTNSDRTELQFGFTKGLSTTKASLITSEGILDSRQNREPLYVAALDTQKAFDVVSHPILMKMLYFQGIDSHLWQVIRPMYNILTARVKLEGKVSPPVLCSPENPSNRHSFYPFLQNLHGWLPHRGRVHSPGDVNL